MRIKHLKLCSQTFAAVVLLVIALLAHPASAVPLAALAAAKATPQEQAAVTSEAQPNSPQVNALLAGLSDEQVRKLLIEELQKNATQNTSALENQDPDPSSVFGDVLNSLSNQSDSSEERARQLLLSLPDFLPDLNRVFLTLCPYGTHSGAVINLLWVLLFISAGFLVELIFKRLVVKKLFSTPASNENGLLLCKTDKFMASLVKELPNMLGVLLFFAGAYVAYFSFIWTESPFLQLFFLALLISITGIRVILIISRMLFSPSFSAFRILPIPDHMARTFHRALLGVFGYIILVLMLSAVAKKLGAQANTISLMHLLSATLLLGTTATCLLLYKKHVREYIISAPEAYGEEASWGRHQFASIWHLLALAYLLILWLLLFNDLTDPDQKRRGAFILSFFVVPIWMICDKLIQWLVKYMLATLKIYNEQSEDEQAASEEENQLRLQGKETCRKVMSLARTGLVFAMLIWVASLWDIEIPIFSDLSSVLFDALIILTVAILFWQFISNWIERKIEESLPEEEDKKEDEESDWGAAANRGRSYTLLPMLRKFIGSILVTMVAMTILSSMGVDIGPLLAGAGVVGLAVGFGAQKLVADLLSGFFYLLDDAFRVGEYIEAGGVTGTVESISMRNVLLRHHRGMLQIIPHSQLGAITNFMRGGIIVKFNLDFPYDANIDQIRKIIKKVGQAMIEEEEFAKDFILPIKSQGVREITNSVMSIRVKFTAKPGAHFLIRREAFKRITEALRAKGIDYAHKRVIVDIPDIPQNADANTRNQIIQAAGAAVRETIDAEEKKAAEAAVAKT